MFRSPKPTTVPALALLVSLLGTPFTAVRAEENLYSNSPEEIQAESDQAEFDLNYELTDSAAEEQTNSDDAGNSAGDEPDWKKLLHPAIQVRARKGKKATSFVPDVNYSVKLTGPSSYTEGPNELIAPASTSKIFTTSLALKELGGDYKYTTHFSWRKSPKAGEAGYLHLTGSGDPSINGNASGAFAEELVQSMIHGGVKRIYGDLELDATDSRWARRTIPSGWTSGDPSSEVPGILSTVTEAKMKTVLKARLAKHGIRWVAAASAPFAEATGIYGEQNHVSRPLRELIKPFMLHSINYMGEAFLRKVGELKGSKSAPDLLAAALPILREYVNANIGKHSVVLNDGCGLSRTSRVSAAAMVTFLTEMKQENFFDDLFASLPTAGQSGTIGGRMRGTAAAGRVHAKTGTLYTPVGAFQLAGYLVENTKAGPEYHPFAIYTEAESNRVGYCHSTQDRMLGRLASWMVTGK